MDPMIVFKIVMSSLPSLICLIIAGIAALKDRGKCNDRDDVVWGWFLFVGFLLSGLMTTQF